MIRFKNISTDKPYLKFIEVYKAAKERKQKSLEACCISSYNKDECEVNSRFVNIKYINSDKWYFYTNYNSPKSIEFNGHNQISCIFYWESTNSQIRLKAKIFRSPEDESNKYFRNRTFEKNVLAISSKQSEFIESYDAVQQNYNLTKESYGTNSKPRRPIYWGGFYFKPYYFEFWSGHKNRLNKREVFYMKNNNWKKIFLQP